MITKDQAVYLMELVDGIDDASAAMALTANGAHEEYVEASIEWTACYRELRAFVGSIAEGSL
ncbi:hypothetical protein YU13_20870 [Salmonella enterica subsp. enterica serovar Enteritidis]|nr:hypothetical protein [Salmonella enterica subsp. enterica serovar Enteritidis]